jgi:cysteine-rich repeat protein
MRGIIVGALCVGALGMVAACGDDGSSAPEVEGASLATAEDTPVVHAVVARDPAGGALTLQADAPAHGTVSVDRLVVTYTPAANYHGPDAFTVTVSSGAGEASALIEVAVGPVNDAPAAADDSFLVVEDTALVRPHASLLANDDDDDADALVVTSVQGAVNGAVSTAGTDVTFMPAADFSGMASFQYTVSDGKTTSTATVTVQVGGTNDAPVAADDTEATQEDTSVEITAIALVANDADPDGQTLAVTAVGSATNGTVALDGGTVTFTPAAEFGGMATFTYTVSDGAATDTGTVTIAVAAVNDAPVATDDAGSVPAGGSLVLDHATLLANDADVDGPQLAITAVQGAASGTAVLGATTITITPDAGFSGTASFEYVVSDGTDDDVGTVTITVLAGPICGDGTIEAPETCDDGNTADNDGCSSVCQRERLAMFTFTGAAGDEPTFPADVVAPGLASPPVMSRGPGLAVAAAAGELSSELWQLTATFDPTDHYAFTVTPTAGATMTILGIELDERRSLSGPLFWSLRSSLDGFATDLAMFVLPDDDLYRRDQLVPLGAAFANLAAPVEFRIYGWDAQGSLGTWRLDNVEILGFATGP